MSHLFIPEKIKVGYQKRDGTYTGKLAYVIYYDEKGKLRKEPSWQRWRSDDIKPDDFKNEPTEGFVLNKEVQRYNWSHFSSNRSYIRIYDPRGIEFEITPENLIGLLMECDCNKRMLNDKFVYAWQGTELILLPYSSEAYEEAVEHTARQSKKVGARDLAEGCSYTLKNGEEVIYMGRFPWFRWRPSTDAPHARTAQKKHVFWNGEDFEEFSSMTKMSFLNSPEPVQEYAELMDKLKGDIRVQEIVGWHTEPAAPTSIKMSKKYHWYNIDNCLHFKVKGNTIVQYRIHSSHHGVKTEGMYFTLQEECHLDRNTLKVTNVNYRHHYHFHNKTTEQEVLDQLTDCVSVYAILESGRKYKMTEVGTWDMPEQK